MQWIDYCLPKRSPSSLGLWEDSYRSSCLGAVFIRCISLSFLRNIVQTQALIYTRIHSLLWTHTRTLYPYEHLRKTKPADRVLRLTKSPRASRYRRERRLPLKEYSAFMRHIDVKPEVWTLVGWGYNHPPNHRISLSLISHFDDFSQPCLLTCCLLWILPLLNNLKQEP
jgi:hypothetical protein